MRRKITYPLVALGVAAGSTLAVASPALAHGYVSSPPSRQALCASGAVANCGEIQYEPQSVEGKKGQKSCNGGVAQWAVLADESRNWPAKAVTSSATFTWVLTARHRTASFAYYIDGTAVATFALGNAQPDAVVTHQVDLSKFPGRHTVLAVWDIGDTANSFYSCVDVNVGGSSATTPPTSAPATTAPPTTAPPTTAPPTTAPTQTAPTQTAPGAGGGAWAAGVSYRINDVVTYGGARYRCRQPHTSIHSWEPSVYTLALWLPL